jgi:hypothetical protein
LQNMGHAVVSVPVIMKLNTQISILCQLSVTPLCLPYSNKVENSTENFPLLWTTSADVHVAHTLTVASSIKWPFKQFGTLVTSQANTPHATMSRSPCTPAHTTKQQYWRNLAWKPRTITPYKEYGLALNRSTTYKHWKDSVMRRWILD